MNTETMPKKLPTGAPKPPSGRPQRLHTARKAKSDVSDYQSTAAKAASAVEEGMASRMLQIKVSQLKILQQIEPDPQHHNGPGASTLIDENQDDGGLDRHLFFAPPRDRITALLPP